MSRRALADSIQANAAQVQRFRALDEALGLGLAIDGDLSLLSLVRGVLALPGRSPEFRACVALLGASAMYPLRSEVDAVAAFLRHDRVNEAAGSVAEFLVEAGTMAPRRTFVPAADLQIDVTSVSREPTMTGIPRVVVNLIDSVESQASLHVWSHGAAGPCTLLPDGSFSFDPEIWSPARAGRWPFPTLRRGYRRLRLAALDSRLAAMVYSVALVVVRVLIGRLDDQSGPRVCVLFVDCEVMVAEVTRPDVSDRLLTWQSVVGRSRLRVLVHDLLPVTAPEYFTPGHTAEFLTYLHVVAGADHIVTTTTHTASQVRASARLAGHTCPPITTVPLPVTSREWDDVEAAATFVPQFTCVGTIEPRKNQRAVLMAAADLARRSYPVILNLVGSRARMDSGIRDAIARATAAGVDVRLHTGATDAQIKSLMKGSLATVFVSWAEGYGLPVLESLACGVPVIASDVEPIKAFHLYGGVILVDPGDHLAIADAMLGLLADPQARARLVDTIQTADIPVSVAQWASAVLAPAGAPALDSGRST
jgi:glycosyltransferase involved in cell wall biosynthesis